MKIMSKNETWKLLRFNKYFHNNIVSCYLILNFLHSKAYRTERKIPIFSHIVQKKSLITKKIFGIYPCKNAELKIINFNIRKQQIFVHFFQKKNLMESTKTKIKKHKILEPKLKFLVVIISFNCVCVSDINSVWQINRRLIRTKRTQQKIIG